MLEARNTTVAPPGRRSTWLTSNAADADMSVPPAADAKDDNDGKQRGMAQRRRDSAQDNSEQHGMSQKHQDNDGGESTTPFCGQQQDRGGHRSRTPSKGFFFLFLVCS